MHLRRPLRLGATLCVGSLLVSGLIATGSAASADESGGDPDFGPNVHIIDPADDPAQTQALFDSLFDELGTAEFTDQRAAVLFKPGEYSVDAQLGYYTSVAGLGLLPDDVGIEGQVRVEGRVWDPAQPWVDDALTNFWRSLENVSITPSGGAARWAVSQAAPMRRVHIQGDLQLHPQFWGFSSGGFLADSVIDGEAGSGPQQQWYTRNSEVGSWAGSVWNQAFTGVEGAPATSFPSPAYTTVDTTAVSREKPFLYVDDAGDWQVFAPALAQDSRGASWSDGTPEGDSRPIGDFFIAQPDDSIATINAALAGGRDLILTPGIYEYSSPIEVTHPDTIVLGMGYATVVPTAGEAAVEVADVDGVRLAGFTVEAGVPQSDVLIRVSDRGASGDHAANPTSIQDVYVRIGGAREGSAVTSLEVNSDDVIIDHIWMWRADHGAGAAWDSNRGDHGLVVNGDDVSAWGLFVEHYQKNQVIWNGNGGSTFFYQSELPYDPPTQADWMDGSRNGYASYRVADTVTTHTATALGVYSFFTSGAPIDVESAIQVPLRNGVQLHNMVSVFLAGNGSISHVVNDQGAALVGGFGTSVVQQYPGNVPVPGDVLPPTVTVKSGAQFTVESGGVYDRVSVKLHDAGKIDKVTINGVVKDLVNDAWSDVNGIRPGVFGAVRGTNTLVAYDVAGNAKTFTFDLR